MAGLNETARNAILDANSAVWPPDTASLHSADPGNGASPTAATEISGGTPAYARKAAAWGAATGGSKTQTPAAVFDIPGGGTTFGWVGMWRGSTSLGSRRLVDGNGNPITETYATQGTYALTMKESVPA